MLTQNVNRRQTWFALCSVGNPAMIMDWPEEHRVGKCWPMEMMPAATIMWFFTQSVEQDVFLNPNALCAIQFSVFWQLTLYPSVKVWYPALIPAALLQSPYDRIACNQPNVYSGVSVTEWYLQYILKPGKRFPATDYWCNLSFSK